MKKMYKAMLLVLCAVLLVAGSVMGTLAYLKAQTGTVTNTMTVGKVEITLDEAKVNVYGEKLAKDDSVWETGKELADRVADGNEYKLIPGHTYVKDPKITVAANSEASYLFVRIKNDINGIEAAGDNTIAQQMDANGWTPLESGSRIYYRSAAATAEEAEEYPVFASFTIADNANDLEYWNKISSETVVAVTAYAVQADGFSDAQAAWMATYGAPTNP